MIIGARAVEQDYSHYVRQAAKTVLAVVGTAPKGPIGVPTACSSTQDLVNRFGNLRKDCYGLYAGQYFLSQSSKMYYVRAASETAKASSTLVVGGTTKDDSSITDAIKVDMLEKGEYFDGYKLSISVPGLYKFSIVDSENNVVSTLGKVSIDSIKRQSLSTSFKFSIVTEKVNNVDVPVRVVSITPGEYELTGTTSLNATIPGQIYTNNSSTSTEGNAIVVTHSVIGSESSETYKLVIERAYYDLSLKSNNNSLVESIVAKELSELKDYESNYMKFYLQNQQALHITPGDYTFSGGDSGIDDITAADYINAANSLASDSVDINLISVPGQTDAEVITAVLALAEARGDCLYLVDVPEGLDKDGVRNWRNGEGNYNHAAFNSTYGALYYDWTTIYDSVNKEKVIVPPSVTVAATYAYSDRISELWYAPAGLNRGLIRGAIDTATQLSKKDIELLYEDGINAIYNDPQVGLALWGQKTLAIADTALDRVNVRRLLNYLKKVVISACNYLTFESNDRVTWNSFKMKVEPILQDIQMKRGIYEYNIVSGASIVTSSDIDNYKMPGMIMVRPTKVAEEIPIYFTLSSTGADFNEVLDSNGVVSI